MYGVPMKIESIILNHLRMPLVAHFETSFGRIYNRDCILITLQSEGLTGYGECVAPDRQDWPV